MDDSCQSGIIEKHCPGQDGPYSILLRDMDLVGFSGENAKKQVQELAEITGGKPLPRYIQNESDRPTVDPPTGNIPIVDLSRLPLPEEADKLRSALQSWGLFQAVGHGIPSSLLDEVRSVARSFFRQPVPEKQRYYRSEIEGYGNDKVLSDEQILDWSDRLYLQVLPEKERKMELWPQTLPSFRDTLHEYSERTRAIMDVILKALATSLGLVEDCFTGHLGEDAEVFVRFSFYARCSRPDLVFGFKPHTDVTVLSAILQDPDVEGLQVLSAQLGWVNVPVIRDALVVVLGDQLEIMSNGEYKGPMHRVVNSSERERISVSLFYQCGPGREFEPASGLVADGKPKLYKKVKSKEYVDIFLDNFPQGKRTIGLAKA